MFILKMGAANEEWNFVVHFDLTLILFNKTTNTVHKYIKRYCQYVLACTYFNRFGHLHGERFIMLIKRSNLMQQYADIYLLHSHSTCFGCHSTHHQEH